jgi:acyl CoA:acetate/3-ketoacid CoA transferase
MVDLQSAVALIHDGDHVLVGGSGGGHAVPEAWIAALAERFRATGRPRGLSLMSVVAIGDWKTTGFSRLAQPGLVKRVVSAGFNNCPAIGAMAAADEIEAYTLPQGALSQLCRDNYDAMVDQPYRFDFYDGGGLDIAFLSFAEVDAEGNVNVSRFGRVVNGPGGFVNISQGARKVVFSGTPTADGLEIQPDGVGGVRLLREGRTAKWVPAVQQVTFSGRYARSRCQEAMYVTDRVVFRLGPGGIEVVEIAPGVDLAKDVLACIGFPVRVPAPPRPMDPRLFRPDPMGILAEFHGRPSPRQRRRPEP